MVAVALQVVVSFTVAVLVVDSSHFRMVLCRERIEEAIEWYTSAVKLSDGFHRSIAMENEALGIERELPDIVGVDIVLHLARLVRPGQLRRSHLHSCLF